MDSTKYYEELAEMGLILSNMASVGASGTVGASSASPKKWTNNNVGEPYTANNLDEYMYYLGMEHRINHMNENVPYMLGQHDTIALLGKVSNLERNVITLVIGENEAYKDILAANYDGSLGAGSGDDIHHQGYDYYANQIYEQLVNYDNSQTADRWKKSYWIVGYGTGGSIANLVAKKFIDYKHVNTNVYCYTYQAPNTINRNNLTKRIANVKYQSIFNIENTDDIMLNLMGDDTGWTKYGVLKRLSVGDDEKVKKSWNKLTGDSYKGSTRFLDTLFGDILNIFKGIFGFSNSQNDNVTNTEADAPEIAKALIAERNKNKNPVNSQIILNSVNDSQSIGPGVQLNNKGKEAQKQSEDITTNLNIDESYEIKQDLILNPEEEKAKRERAKAQLLTAINDMGEWYVENVATYFSGGLQTQKYGSDKIRDTALYDKSGNMYRWTRAYSDIEDIELKYRDGVEKTYKMIILGESGETDTPDIATYSTVVLRASDDAANSYKDNFDDIELNGSLGLNYYPCDKLEKGEDNYTKAGDDCVRFAFACFKNMDENFITNFKTYSGYNWNGVNTKSFAGKEEVNKDTPNANNKNLKVAYAMSKLGFEVYDIDSNICTSYDMDGDGKNDFTINNITDSFKLEATDLLAIYSDNFKHVHFCLEDESVVGKVKKNFGWGKVFREYPVKCTFWYNNGSHNNGYTRVYRYVGR